ncbi:hypothetical protein VPH35_118563 [Triticum aestivum]
MVRRLPQRRRGRALRVRTTGEAFEGYGPVRRGFPSWVAAADRRRLLQQQGVVGVPDLVVAKDGSGNFTTVGEARGVGGACGRVQLHVLPGAPAPPAAARPPRAVRLPGAVRAHAEPARHGGGRALGREPQRGGLHRGRYPILSHTPPHPSND